MVVIHCYLISRLIVYCYSRETADGYDEKSAPLTGTAKEQEEEEKN